MVNHKKGGTQKRKKTSKGGNQPPKNKITNKLHIKTIFKYSAKKKK